METSVDKVEPPMLSASAAAALSVGSSAVSTLVAATYTPVVAFVVLYVLPFYLSSTTRPSPTLSRDAPSVIRARIRFVSLSVSVCSLVTLYVVSTPAEVSYSEILRLLGWYPVSAFDIAKVLWLTALFFAGPLFEKGVIESGWQHWVTGRDLYETLSSWIGWRNYIAGPFTEELLFRSLLLSLHLLVRPSLHRSILIFVTPLYFGIAHIHHFYEYTLTHPFTPLLPALLRSIVQFGYTTVFGWYAAFLFLRTGNLWGVVLVHAFCNWVGLPRVWGKVDNDRKDGGAQKLDLTWTAAYYLTLVVGALAWWKGLWVLSKSERELMTIG